MLRRNSHQPTKIGSCGISVTLAMHNCRDTWRWHETSLSIIAVAATLSRPHLFRFSLIDMLSSFHQLHFPRSSKATSHYTHQPVSLHQRHHDFEKPCPQHPPNSAERLFIRRPA